MKLFKRIAAAVLVLAMGTCLMAGCGSAPAAEKKPEGGQEGPWKPTSSMNIRVPFKAGGSADTIARIAAKGLEQTYGQSVIVNNLTGANGAIAATDLLSMEAQPTELMVAGITLFTLAPLFNPDIQMNLDDFEMVGSLISEDFVMLANPAKTGIDSFEALLDYAKDNRVICAGNPAGGTTHMLATALFGKAGINGEVLSEDGGAQNALAAASGDAAICIVSASAALQFIQDGSLKPIACFSEEEYTGYGDGIVVPTVKSKGYDIVFKSCNFLMAKKGADKAALDQIYSDILAYRDTDEFKEMAENAKYVPDNQNGDQVRETVEAAAEMCKSVYDEYYAK